jgi:hypothetical protein
MKKTLAVLCVLALLISGIPTAMAETAPVDAYTSASTTKKLLEGADLAAAAEALAANSADLATLADSKVSGYAAPQSALAQIMSVNPDGSVGLSTISQWKYIPADNQVHIQLTYGQNALNLNAVGARGSLLVKIGDLAYILHLDVAEAIEKVYSDEAFNAGEFNAHYSGADAHFSQFDIFLNVLSIETSGAIMF